MKTSNKLLLGFYLFILLTITISLVTVKSSLSNVSIETGGSKITEKREVKHFKGIAVHTGITLYLEQGTEESVKVKTDEKIIDKVITVVKDGILTVHLKPDIQHRLPRLIGIFNQMKQVEVFVKAVDLSYLECTSGSSIKTLNAIATENLTIEVSSSGDGEISVNCSKLFVNASSGADLKLSGSTENVVINGSAGSDVIAEELLSVNAEVNLNSGTFASVNVKDALTANASSGADIYYMGEPKLKNINISSGGKVKQK